MDIIKLERWKPSETDPRSLEYAGQFTAQEVFEELKHQLEDIGYLPDEYFRLESEWENNREVPRGAKIFCAVDCGLSKGAYLNVYLKWYDKNQEKYITKSFITGKTLGENGNDLDRMFFTASLVTKAFYSDYNTRTLYLQLGTRKSSTSDSVVQLSQQEQKAIIEALVEQWALMEQRDQTTSQIEQLLRRITGNITEYINKEGMYPLRMSDYDKALLAIRDGDMPTFQELCPKVLATHADELLIAVSGRPGAVGAKMMGLVLENDVHFSEDIYRTACQKAVDIEDLVRVQLLLAAADHDVPELSPSFPGEIACYAEMEEHRFIAAEIIKQCSEEQIAAAPPILLELFAEDKDVRSLSTLIEKGFSGNSNAWNALYILTGDGRGSRIAIDLLKKRMWVPLDDYRALHACVQNGAPEVGKLLLDGGMDFDQYQQWAQTQPGVRHGWTLQILADHWSMIQEQRRRAERRQAGASGEIQQNGGMTLWN